MVKVQTDTKLSFLGHKERNYNLILSFDEDLRFHFSKPGVCIYWSLEDHIPEEVKESYHPQEWSDVLSFIKSHGGNTKDQLATHFEIKAKALEKKVKTLEEEKKTLEEEKKSFEAKLTEWKDRALRFRKYIGKLDGEAPYYLDQEWLQSKEFNKVLTVRELCNVDDMWIEYCTKYNINPEEWSSYGSVV